MRIREVLSSRYAVYLLLTTTHLCWSAGSPAQQPPRLVRVFVALADNEHQGIVPVPNVLGNGEDAERNLYWGAAFGVRTFFKKSEGWQEIATLASVSPEVLERSVFYNSKGNTYLVADAYRGREIRRAIIDFFRTAAGHDSSVPTELQDHNHKIHRIPARADVAVYVGHDGLMDFQLSESFPSEAKGKREVIVLACASKVFFGPGLRATGAEPLLWTIGLMAPEAYTLKAALDGWIVGESSEGIRKRAAEAYARYQKISTVSASRLFASGW